jgi:hypothetical protein
MPKSHEKIIQEFPIQGLAKNWYFRVREVSNGVFRVEASDIHGRTVSRIGTETDSQKMLDESAAYAKQIQTEVKSAYQFAS